MPKTETCTDVCSDTNLCTICILYSKTLHVDFVGQLGNMIKNNKDKISSKNVCSRKCTQVENIKVQRLLSDGIDSAG